jgi:hypothetical protein
MRSSFTKGSSWLAIAPLLALQSVSLTATAWEHVDGSYEATPLCRISSDWTHLISFEWDHPISG